MYYKKFDYIFKINTPNNANAVTIESFDNCEDAVDYSKSDCDEAMRIFCRDSNNFFNDQTNCGKWVKAGLIRDSREALDTFIARCTNARINSDKICRDLLDELQTTHVDLFDETMDRYCSERYYNQDICQKWCGNKNNCDDIMKKHCTFRDNSRCDCTKANTSKIETALGVNPVCWYEPCKSLLGRDEIYLTQSMRVAQCPSSNCSIKENDIDPSGNISNALMTECKTTYGIDLSLPREPTPAPETVPIPVSDTPSAIPWMTSNKWVLIIVGSILLLLIIIIIIVSVVKSNSD